MTARDERAAVTARLDAAIEARITPAAVVETGSAIGPAWRVARGRLTYDPGGPEADADTIFDLASLTKVIATATLAMQAIDAGLVTLDTRVASIEPRWSATDRHDVTLRHLLDHSSGLPAHVKLYETVRDIDAAVAHIAATPLAFAPGTRAEYSDLGFILLGALLERLLGRTLDQAFTPVATRLGEPLAYRPPAAWRARIAPTEVDPWRGRVLQGEVHDENAAALGGVAGHAGLFGTAAAVGAFARAVLQTEAGDTWLARRHTLETFTTRSAVPGSSRALGWDTMLPTSSCGTRMSTRAIGHTGFTGTSLWIDPARDLYVVLLTNRVHPTRHGEGIQGLRRDASDIVGQEPPPTNARNVRV